MYYADIGSFDLWWIIPIGMMILCGFIMRWRSGSRMCGFDPRGSGHEELKGSFSALEILDRRYASGEIDKAEYDEKRRVLIEGDNR